MTKNERRQPDDVLAQVLAKFIINLPEAELNPNRIWFHYQNAYLFYYQHQKNKKTKNKEQQYSFFQKLNKLAPPRFKINPTTIIEDIQKYHDNIPVYGAILINKQKTKMVCTQNQKQHLLRIFGFTKGKINEGQDPIKCATRLIMQQIGYDITENIDQNCYIKIEGKTPILFFVIHNVQQQTTIFKIQNSSQINNVRWVFINQTQFHFSKVAKKVLKQLNLFLQKDRHMQQKTPLQLFQTQQSNQLPKTSQFSYFSQIPKSPQVQTIKSQFEIFLQNFQVELKNIQTPKNNPFIDFKFDTQQATTIFK